MTNSLHQSQETVATGELKCESPLTLGFRPKDPTQTDPLARLMGYLLLGVAVFCMKRA